MRALTILSLLLIAVRMGLSLAHALEWPGKLHLNEAAYKTTQAIYYPGFTFGGLVGEFGGMIALAVLLYLTPFGTSRFWWTAAALLLMVAAHGTYWLMTHPINNFWVKDVATSAAGGHSSRSLPAREPGTGQNCAMSGNSHTSSGPACIC